MSMVRGAYRAHVVVASDRAHGGIRPDETAPKLIAELTRLGYQLTEPATSIVPDERERIRVRLRELLSEEDLSLILTTGGTGAAPRDVTPEATRDVIERELPGFGELMRAESLKKTATAAGSRALAGTVGRTLIINLPGSPSGAVECLGFVARAARHVLDLLSGAAPDCSPSEPPSFR